MLKYAQLNKNKIQMGRIMMTQKWVYQFGQGSAEGHEKMKDLLGGKGANLAEMSNLDLPVPPGFTITTDVCSYYYGHGKTYPETLKKQVTDAIAEIEQKIGMHFGDPENPLLVSVRSGARVSMPGMMDTVLNLGLTDQTVLGLKKKSQDGRFAYDSYRRFIQMYADVVLGVDHYLFEDVLESFKRHNELLLDTDLTEADWISLVDEFKHIVEQETGQAFPQDPYEQLWTAIGAVFNSWQNPRAEAYRQMHEISAAWGTAVTVQSMVFGNMGDDCATGVAFTRNPSTGENMFYGEYLINAQGEDVVAGIRTPQHLTIKEKEAHKSKLPAMEETMPKVFEQLLSVRHILEQHYRDIQDIEFTVQKNKLYMLQTRSGKRTAQAAIKIAVDLCHEGLISKEEAVNRIDPQSLDQLLHPTLDPKAATDILTVGLPASPGAATGRIVFNSVDAERISHAGEKVILCRVETSPDDIQGMHAAEGILTSRGGMTSHAAVVARGMGRACVAGAAEVLIDYDDATLTVGDRVFSEGDYLTIDGGSGQVLAGQVAMIRPELTGCFAELMSWADSYRVLQVRANADTPQDAKVAQQFGAEGIGLCRTEHMFFDGNRILTVREMILASNSQDRRKALTKLLPMQRQDFAEIFRVMDGAPVTIRLLDPPLHEFLPHSAKEMQQMADIFAMPVKRIKERVAKLQEVNPMLGHRGCRLGITYPEIYEMQVEALTYAALDSKDSGVSVFPEIMIPLVGTVEELKILRARVDAKIRDIFDQKKESFQYSIGTMIELPRAALVADKISEYADFFSFGTNDLTQTTFGLSRDDAASFLPDYQRAGIFERDPFASLDQEGVGELVRIATEKGRGHKEILKLGICGEHGGDPASIAFCHKIGLNYVSCSAYRVPIARLAAAQISLKT